VGETVRVRGEAAEIQFYDANADSRRIAKYDTKPMWRGDHRRCNHNGGTCIAARAWIVEGDSWKIRAHVVPINIEERAMGTVSYPGQKGRYPESTQSAKGNVDWSPELASVTPTDQVKRHHIERHIREVTATLKAAGAKYGEIQVAVKERRDELEAANGLSRPAKAKKAE